MFGNRSIIDSFKHSFEGVSHAFFENRNMRIHVSVGAIVLMAGLIFNVSKFEMIIIAVMIILVIMMEMINTAIEEMVDLIVTEHHKQAKIAKDVASGMVLVAVIGSVIAGAFIFLPHVLKLLG